MEELIKMAFSGMEYKIDRLEEKINELLKTISKLENDLTKEKEKIKEITSLITTTTNRMEEDELEVYKFGE